MSAQCTCDDKNWRVFWNELSSVYDVEEAWSMRLSRVHACDFTETLSSTNHFWGLHLKEYVESLTSRTMFSFSKTQAAIMQEICEVAPRDAALPPETLIPLGICETMAGEHMSLVLSY